MVTSTASEKETRRPSGPLRSLSHGDALGERRMLRSRPLRFSCLSRDLDRPRSLGVMRRLSGDLRRRSAPPDSLSGEGRLRISRSAM